MTGEVRGIPPRPESSRSPYPGLVPFSEEDTALFFGRQRERQFIGKQVLASRLTVVYGPAGVGKSSLLLAGAVPDLRAQGVRRSGDAEHPDLVPIVFLDWRDDPVAGLGAAILAASEQDPTEPAPLGGIADALDELAQSLRSHIVVVLDQFEDYFVYHGAEGDTHFIDELADCVSRPRLRASFLISIREDAFGRLDILANRIPELYDNLLRVEHLSRSDAFDAIVRPIAVTNQEGAGWVIEDELVARVLDQVGGVHRLSGEELRIHPDYLQIVMTLLWEQEVSAGSKVLRAATLDRLGGAGSIVATLFDRSLADLPDEHRAIAAELFRYLITPSGTRFAHTASDLASFVRLPTTEVETVLNELARDRIVRTIAPAPGTEVPEPRYEIFHSALSQPGLEWTRRFQVEEEARRRIRRVRRLSMVVAVSLVLLLVEAVALLGSFASR